MSKNLILQHWKGLPLQINYWSMDNISSYANKCGADYRFITGDVFNYSDSHFAQKLHMLDSYYDEYNTVVMMDMDMFASAIAFKNIFDDDVIGVGVCDDGNKRNARARMSRTKYYNPNAPFWGGSIYRMERDLRQKLREQLPNVTPVVWKELWRETDEGMLHHLASLANIPHTDSLLDDRWSQGHFVNNIEEVYIIHMRYGTRNARGGRIDRKNTKEDNYRMLKEKGIV